MVRDGNIVYLYLFLRPRGRKIILSRTGDGTKRRMQSIHRCAVCVIATSISDGVAAAATTVYVRRMRRNDTRSVRVASRSGHGVARALSALQRLSTATR